METGTSRQVPAIIDPPAKRRAMDSICPFEPKEIDKKETDLNPIYVFGEQSTNLVKKGTVLCEDTPSDLAGKRVPRSSFRTYPELGLHSAGAALAHYNMQHGTNYKLVSVLENKLFMPFEENCRWSHCNFLAAVPEQPPPSDESGSFYIKFTDDDSSSSLKLFFAELKDPGCVDPVVSVCCILDDDDQVKFSCRSCRCVAHPVSGFQKGLGYRTAVYGAALC